MIVRKFLEHADHVVLIGIHEALGVHLGFAHRKQARWVRCCAGMAAMMYRLFFRSESSMFTSFRGFSWDYSVVSRVVTTRVARLSNSGMSLRVSSCFARCSR